MQRYVIVYKSGIAEKVGDFHTNGLSAASNCWEEILMIIDTAAQSFFNRECRWQKMTVL